MTDALDTMGPIDYLVVEFPGSRMTGEGLPLLVDLVDRGIIRILDLVFIRKELDGSVTGIEIADFDADGTLDLAVFEGASSGLLGTDEVEERRIGPRTGQLRRHPRLREPLGRAVGRRAAPRRRPTGRQWTDPHPGGTRRAGRRRSQRLTTSRHERNTPSCQVYSAGSRVPPPSREPPPPCPTGSPAAKAAAGPPRNNNSNNSSSPRRSSSTRSRRRSTHRSRQYAPPPPAAPPRCRHHERQARAAQRTRRAEDSRVLTEAEFEAQKQRILG